MHDMPIHGNRQNLHKWTMIQKTGSLRQVGMIAIGLIARMERCSKTNCLVAWMIVRVGAC